MIKKLISYLIRGVIFVMPFIATVWLIGIVFNWIGSYIPRTVYGGLVSLFIVLASLLGLVLFGYLGSSLLMRPLGNYIEGLINKTPLIGFIYSSMKDLMKAFVGKERKFEKPVLVKESEYVYRPGFITQSDLNELNLPGKVAVYLPHSYAFSGMLFIVDKENVSPVDVKSSNMMKFIVSGGVAGFDSK